MKLRCLIFILLVLSALLTFAKADSTKVKPKFIFQFDARNSFAFEQRIRMGGIKIGLEFNKKHRIGLGFYDNAQPIVLEKIDALDHKAVIDFNYTTLYYEYVFYQTKKWEFTFPVFIGGGNAQLSLKNADFSDIIDSEGNNLSGVQNLPFTLLGPSVSGQYKITRWLGVGSGVGYSQLLSTNDQLRKSITSPYYSIKLKIFVFEIFKKNPNKPKK